MTEGENRKNRCLAYVGRCADVIAKPAWVISDEALDAVDESGRELVSSNFSSEMTGPAVVSISSRANTGFYSRVIRLDCQVNDPVQGETIRRVRDAQHPAS